MDERETGQITTPPSGQPSGSGPARVSVPPPGFVPVGQMPARNPAPIPLPFAAREPSGERERVPGGVRLLGGCLVLFALVAVACGLLAGFSALVIGNAHTATATETGVIPVASGETPTLAISGEALSVYVVPSPDAKIHYTLEKWTRGITQQQANQALGEVRVSARHDGNTVTIGLSESGLNPVTGWLSRRVTLTVETPPRAIVHVTLSAGTLAIRDLTLTGDSTIGGTAGTVTLTRVTIANSLDARMTSGAIDMQGALAASARLNLRVTAGQVRLGLPANTSAHLEARVTTGSLQVDGWASVQTTTAHNGPSMSAQGDLNPHPTGSVTIEATSGAVRVYAQ